MFKQTIILVYKDSFKKGNLVDSGVLTYLETIKGINKR